MHDESLYGAPVHWLEQVAHGASGRNGGFAPSHTGGRMLRREDRRMDAGDMDPLLLRLLN